MEQNNKKDILLVEDNPLLAGMYKRAFEFAQCSVRIAESGEEGLEQIREKAPDALLFDVFMHGMSGIEMLKELQADERFDDMLKVVITSSGEDEIREQAMAAGADEFIVKSEEEISNIVNRVMEKAESR